MLRRSGQQPNLQGIPTRTILAANGLSQLDYNPLMDFRTETQIRLPNNAEKDLAHEIDKVVKELHSANWVPPPEKYSPLDDGAFGKEVHERVGNKYRGKSGWLVNGFFEEMSDGNWRFLGTDLADRQGKTEVDIMRLKRGYRLQPNMIVNRDLIESITDIKNTASGKLDFAGPDSQGQRLLRLTGNNPSKLRVLVPVQRYTRLSGWSLNKKFAALGAILFFAGVADTTYNVLHAEQFDQEFDAVVSEARRINGLMGQDYDTIVKPQLILWQIQVHNYLKHFMVTDEPLTLVTILRIYKLMGSENWELLQYDPEEDE